MHRGIRMLRVGARCNRTLQNSTSSRFVRAAQASAAPMASAWPSAVPSVAASTTSSGTSKTGSARVAGTADGLLDMLSDDEDETRFRKREDRDRGPPTARREGARNDFQRGGRGGERGGAGGRFGGRNHDGGGGQRRGDDDNRGASRAAVVDASAPLEASDYMTLTDAALEAFPADLAAASRVRWEEAVEAEFPYDEDVSPLEAQRAANEERPFNDGTQTTAIDEDLPEDPECDWGERLGERSLAEQDLRELGADEAKFILQSMKDDAEVQGPIMHAVVGANGAIVPLDEEDAERLDALKQLPPRALPMAIVASPAARAALILRGTLARRAIRATFTEAEVERLTAAITVQRGSSDDVWNARATPFAARRSNAYAAGADPLMDREFLSPSLDHALCGISNPSPSTRRRAAL